MDETKFFNIIGEFKCIENYGELEKNDIGFIKKIIHNYDPIRTKPIFCIVCCLNKKIYNLSVPLALLEPINVK